MPLTLTSEFLKSLHLDRGQLWLNARQTQLLHELYNLLDVHGDGKWNDAIFYEVHIKPVKININDHKLRDLRFVYDKYKFPNPCCFDYSL